MTSSKLNLLLIIVILTFASSCKKGGTGFDSFSDPAEESTNSLITAPIINSYSPTEDPVILLSNTEKTFVLGVNSTSGEVNYEFILDGSTVKTGKSSFYTLNAISITPGAHTLNAKVVNSLGSVQKSFNVYKNSSPVFTLNSQTATTINCSSGTYVLNVSATDPDSDALTFTFLLNGATNGTYLSGTTGTNSASVTFTPTCSISGSNFVTIRATDSKGEYKDYTSNINVTNPFSASIDNFSPTTEPTVVQSTATTNFTITPSGTSPFAYSWSVTPGSTVASCSGLATCPIRGTDFTPGRYVLTATLTDNLPSTATKAFTIVLNQKPQVSASPSNASTINMNCNTIKNFNLTIQDANYGDNTQNFSVSWKLNGGNHASLTETTVLNAYPMTSEATFSPNCDSSIIGSQSISVVVSDGHESQTFIWPLNVNYFSEACNNLTSGQICTAVGRVGISGDLNLATEASKVSLQPWNMVKHSANAYFITDQHRDGVWFWNGSGSAITLFGSITVNANSLKFIIGQGAYGSNTPSTISDLYLSDPRGIAYDTSAGSLYIADYSNNRIMKISSTGAVTQFAGGVTAASALANNTDGGTRNSHRCLNPNDLHLDQSENKLFVTCWGNNGGSDGALKYFRTDVDEGHTVVRYSGTASMNTVGTYASAGRARRVYGLTKHPNKKVLFVEEHEVCQIYAISYGDTDSYYGGTVNLGANQMVRLTNNAGCGDTVDRVYTDTSMRIRAQDLAPIWDGTTLKGLMLANYDTSVIHVLNLTNSNFSIGGRSITATQVQNITISGASYGRNIPAFSNTYFRNPFGMILDGNNILVADTQNGFITKYDITQTNGVFTDILGFEPHGLYDGESHRSLNERRLNRPTSLIYKSSDNSMYIVDDDNYRIRKLELNNGRLTTYLGSGSFGNATIDPSTSPQTAGSHNIWAMNFLETDNILVYADWAGSDGTNRNCHVRALNSEAGDIPQFGQTLLSNRVKTVAGSYSLGCAAYSAGDEGQSAVTVPLRYPSGVIASPTSSELYIADRSSHCVYSVNGSGARNSVLGTCGTASDTPGSAVFSTSHLLSSPGYMKKDRNSSYESSGNFFIVQRSRTTSSEVRYYNNSASRVTINFIDIDPGEIKTIFSSLNFVNGVTSFGDQICYSQGSDSNGSQYPHNVECINRSTGAMSLRIGRPSASTVKAKIPLSTEQEGASASTSTLAHPYDIEFDGDGNLWISEVNSNNIRKVKKWF